MLSLIVPILTSLAYISLGLIFSKIVKKKTEELEHLRKQLDVQAYCMNNIGFTINQIIYSTMFVEEDGSSPEPETRILILTECVPVKDSKKEFTVSQYKFYCPANKKYVYMHWEDIYQPIFGKSLLK